MKIGKITWGAIWCFLEYGLWRGGQSAAANVREYREGIQVRIINARKYNNPLY